MKKNFAPFFICFLGFVILTSILLISYPKAELHLLLNSHHTPLQDFFFHYWSAFAESAVYVIALLPLLFWKAGWTYLYAVTEICSALSVFILKHIFTMPRPITYFEKLPYTLPLVDGVHMHHSNSFPSGHSATFFVFFTLCALLVSYHYKHKDDGKPHFCKFVFATLLIIPCILGACSRVYLSQHFLSDILAGSIIGFTTSCLVFHIFYRKQYFDKEWFNRSLWGHNAYFKREE